MRQNPPEVIAAYLIFLAFWVALVFVLLAFGSRWPRTRAFRERMLAQRRFALGIALVYFAAALIARLPDLGQALFGATLGGVGAFCQSLVGLALATGIPGHEPLRVTEAVTSGNRPVRAVALMLVTGVVAGAVGLLVGSVGIGIAQSIFHETNRTAEVASSFDTNLFQAFFLFLSGAGIAEETPYRLVLVPLLWRLTKRPWLAIVAAALVFGLYHLTPLDGLYRQFLQFPISQVLASLLIGLLWGWLYVRRGYETAVLGHTMSDWLGVLLITLVPSVQSS